MVERTGEAGEISALTRSGYSPNACPFKVHLRGKGICSKR